MADIGLSAFSVFFMGSPSFMAHRRALEEGLGRSNCQTLFGMTAIPSDAYIRLMLDGASPTAFGPLFFQAIETEGVLTPFQRLGGRTRRRNTWRTRSKHRRPHQWQCEADGDRYGPVRALRRSR